MTRKVLQYFPFGAENLYNSHDPCKENVCNTILERVFYHKVDGVYIKVGAPESVEVNQSLRNFERRIKCVSACKTPIKLDEVPDLYEGNRRMIYRNSVSSLNDYDLCKRDAKITMFLKNEKIDFQAKPEAPARAVSSRGTPMLRRYHAVAKRHFKRVEPTVFHSINRVFKKPCGGRVVAKGMNARQMAGILVRQFKRVGRAVALSLDASRFDQHVSIPLLKFEHRVYTHINKHPEFARLLRWQLVNKVVACCNEGSWKYTVEGSRMSGDLNTSVGNVLIMCAMCYSFMEHLGIERYGYVNNGDDCILIVEEGCYERVAKSIGPYFDRFGMVMRVDNVARELEHILFCQCHPVCLQDGWRMVRNVPTHMAKDLTNVHGLNTERLRATWLFQVGLCGSSCGKGVPLQEAFYRMMMRLGKNYYPKANLGENRGLAWMSRKLESKAMITMQARVSFAEAFDISPADQVVLEHYYDSVDSLAGVAELPEGVVTPSCPYW